MNGFGSLGFHTGSRQAGKLKMYLNQSEMDWWREHYKDNELGLQWLDNHAELYEVLSEEPTLLEKLNERHGLNKKEPPALNRADRRRQFRKRK